MTDEQIEKARRDFVRGCAEEKHDVNISASWRPGTAAIRDAKISEALNEAIQAPMDQAGMTAAIEKMMIEINDGKVKVPELFKPERSNVFKKPGVDKPINVEARFTYQHMPYISAVMLRDKKAQMANYKLNGVTVKNMTLAEFQAVWAQQIEDQAQSRSGRIMLDRLAETTAFNQGTEEQCKGLILDKLAEAAARQEISRAQMKNPCAEIVIGDPEPDVLTSASPEKQRIEENLAKLKASQTLNESERFELEQHLVGLKASLTIRERDNRLANDARHAKYEEFMAVQNEYRKQDIQRREELVQEIQQLESHGIRDDRVLEIDTQDVRHEGGLIKRQKAWVDTEAEPVIVKATSDAIDQAEDRIRRHMKAYDGPPESAAMSNKRPCPDCRGSGKYTGFNHTETCPNCKGSKVV